MNTVDMKTPFSRCQGVVFENEMMLLVDVVAGNKNDNSSSHSCLIKKILVYCCSNTDLFCISVKLFLKCIDSYYLHFNTIVNTPCVSNFSVSIQKSPG